MRFPPARSTHLPAAWSDRDGIHRPPDLDDCEVSSKSPVVPATPAADVELKGCEVAQSLAALFTGFTRPWYVAGGWALDLFLGRATREHQDIDVAVFREDQSELRNHFVGWRFQKVVKRGSLVREAWDGNELLALPVHEVHALSPRGDLELEVLLNESSGENWIFRRNPAVTLARSSLGRLAQSRVPYLTPEVVLLYKSGHPSAVDEADFAIVHRSLDINQRHWLAGALGVCYPGHHWLSAL
jgi:Aminoglycoside-2''-adenylyltransferase